MLFSLLLLALLSGALPGAMAPAKRRASPPAKPAATKNASKTGNAEQLAVARWLKPMTLRDEVAQMVMVPFSGRPLNTRSRAFRDFSKLVTVDHVGGLILVNVTQGRLVAKAEPLDVAAFLNRMQRLAKVPLIVSADLERGASMRLNATTVFPHAMAIAAGGEPSAARFEGEVTAREARAVGIQWVLFPVADVNNNPDNPIINIRSFGESPEMVAAFADAFIEGARVDRKTRVLTTAKHFPGHGDTATDSHLHMPVIAAGRERLDRVEFFPFRAAIANGVDAVMTAHIAVPSLDGPDIPATLSTKMLTGILRDEFAFKGLVVTDALEMRGIAGGFGNGEAAVRSVQAGADVLLMPPDPHAAIEAVVAAVNSGKIERKRIRESVSRILTAKARVGLASGGVVDLEAINEVVNSPESNARAQEFADRAVTLVKNEGVLPLQDPAKTCFWSLAESRTANEGFIFAAELKKRSPNSRMILLDAQMTDDDIHQAEQQAEDPTGTCDTNVVAAFVSVSAYRGDLTLAGGFPALMTRLLASKKPLIMVSLGTPYLLRSYPDVQAYLATYSTVPPSEIAAVRALFGEIAIRGHLPVTIPNLANIGYGIQQPVSAKATTAMK